MFGRGGVEQRDERLVRSVGNPKAERGGRHASESRGALYSALTWSVAVGLFRWPACAEVVVVGVVHEWFAAVFEHLGLVDGGKVGALSEPCFTCFRFEREPVVGEVFGGGQACGGSGDETQPGEGVARVIPGQLGDHAEGDEIAIQGGGLESEPGG